MFQPDVRYSKPIKLDLHPVLKSWAARYCPDEADQEKLVVQTLLRIENLDDDLPVKEALFQLMRDTFLGRTVPRRLAAQRTALAEQD